MVIAIEDLLISDCCYCQSSRLIFVEAVDVHIVQFLMINRCSLVEFILIIMF